MTSGEIVTVKLAAIQARSEPGRAEANREHATPFIEQAAAQGAGLIVLPELFSCGHAWPTAWKAGGAISENDIAVQQARMTELPRLYARSLGVPVVFANQAGPLAPMGGILGRLMNPRHYRLRGQSRIIDSDGSVLAELAEDEGVVVATTTMDPSRMHYQPQPSYGGWLQPGPALARKVIIPLDITVGRLSYSLSHQRKQKAHATGAGPAQHKPGHPALT
jgi:predicted amidohydrolase